MDKVYYPCRVLQESDCQRIYEKEPIACWNSKTKDFVFSVVPFDINGDFLFSKTTLLERTNQETISQLKSDKNSQVYF